MNPSEDDDLKPSTTPGYKPGVAKTVEEYAQLDAEDESLTRWKASLGIVPGAMAGDTCAAKLTVISLELISEALPPDMKLAFSQEDIAHAKERSLSFVIKEGVVYQVRIKFSVDHNIISGLRYLQVVKRAGVKVDKMEEMIGSYGPQAAVPYFVKDFDPATAPSGLIARSGQFSMRSRILDDDGKVHADWEWKLSFAKEWAPQS